MENYMRFLQTEFCSVERGGGVVGAGADDYEGGFPVVVGYGEGKEGGAGVVGLGGVGRVRIGGGGWGWLRGGG